MSKINNIAAILNVCRILSHLLRTFSWEMMKRTISTIPWKKDYVSVYIKRKVYFASLHSFLKKQDRGPSRFGIAVIFWCRSTAIGVCSCKQFTIKTIDSHIADQLSHFQNVPTESVNNSTEGKAVVKKELGHYLATEYLAYPIVNAISN